MEVFIDLHVVIVKTLSFPIVLQGVLNFESTCFIAFSKIERRSHYIMFPW